MTQSDSDYGEIRGIRISDGAAKPIKQGRFSPGRWISVWEHFQPLPVGGGKMITVTLDTRKDANRLNSSIHGYAETRHCRKEGWKVRMETHPRPDGLVDAWLWKEAI